MGWGRLGWCLPVLVCWGVRQPCVGSTEGGGVIRSVCWCQWPWPCIFAQHQLVEECTLSCFFFSFETRSNLHCKQTWLMLKDCDESCSSGIPGSSQISRQLVLIKSGLPMKESCMQGLKFSTAHSRRRHAAFRFSIDFTLMCLWNHSYNLSLMFVRVNIFDITRKPLKLSFLLILMLRKYFIPHRSRM